MISYEEDRLYSGGLRTGSESASDRDGGASIYKPNFDFSTQLQSHIQFGEKFRAYPTCVNHCHLPSLFQLVKEQCLVYRDILGLNSGFIPVHTKYVLSVKLFEYPEGLCTLWLIIGSISKE